MVSILYLVSCIKNHLCINRIWPRDRLSDQWRISCQLPKKCGHCICISYSRRLVDEHLLSGFWCGRKCTLPVSDIAVMYGCISYIYLMSSRVMPWWCYSLDEFLSVLDLCICPMRTWHYQLFWAFFPFLISFYDGPNYVYCRLKKSPHLVCTPYLDFEGNFVQPRSIDKSS